MGCVMSVLLSDEQIQNILEQGILTHYLVTYTLFSINNLLSNSAIIMILRVLPY